MRHRFYWFCRLHRLLSPENQYLSISGAVLRRDLTAFLFCHNDTRFTVFLELFSDGRFIEHHGRFKTRQIFRIDFPEQLGNGLILAPAISLACP